MAKIKLQNGTREVARIRVTASLDDAVAHGLFVLRSDGGVLHRMTKPYATAYTLLGKVKTVPADADEALRLLERIAARQRFEVVR